MPTITLESSERSKKKSRLRSNLRSYGTRHGDKFWEEEKQRNNFGLKYMNKFGWNKGDGLGKNKQGHTNNIKTKYKNDNKGIGCKHTQNDTMFQATMCMFNDILSGLNKKKDSSNTSNTSEQPTTKHLTASAVIKSYEAKHHLYGKFRAAKNISNRSEQDKSELFGNVGSNGFTESDQTNYALRMSAISSEYSGKMGLGFGRSDDNNIDRDSLLFGKFTRSGIITRDDIINDRIETEKKEDVEFETKKKKKKKKKDKKKKKKTDVSVDGNGVKKKKKKKKKHKMVGDDINIVICDRMSVEMKEDIKCKKKKKKKKGKKRRLTENKDDIVIQPPLKKLKVDKEVIDGNMSDVSSTASILSSVQTPLPSDVEGNIEDKKRKKKKKKKKDKDKTEKSDKSKKKKKKKKKKRVTE